MIEVYLAGKRVEPDWNAVFALAEGMAARGSTRLTVYRKRTPSPQRSPYRRRRRGRA